MNKEQLFIFSTDVHLEQFVKDLTDHYIVEKESVYQEGRVYYDTFDWRLYNKSLLLFRTTDTLFLQSLHDNTILERVAITSPPVFASDFPCGRLQATAASILDMRALLPLFTLHAQCTRMRVMNTDAKTVVRFCYEQDTLAEAADTLPFASCCWLQPIRGYEKHAKRLAKWLREKGGAVSQDSRYFQGLAAVQKQPGDYTSKIRLSLQASLRADVATKMILRELLQVIQRNEAGIVSDIDTEFLHDYRVAIRRTRSALGQIKAVFPAAVTDRFRKHFARLGSVTNRLRDLDVYLLHEADYKGMLPASLRPDIEPLFARIRRERAQARRSVIRRLQSKSYADLLRRWEAFLDQPPVDTPSAMNASRPILDVAQERIRRKCRRVKKVGQQVLTTPDEQELHMLRIECKKLRYLLEFFFKMLPEKQVTRLIKQLRTLQDNLGRYNDVCVQQEALRNFATTVRASDSPASNTLRAIDSLVGTLETEKQTLQQAFPELFRTFVRQIA